jgi:hypothetical protein
MDSSSWSSLGIEALLRDVPDKEKARLLNVIYQQLAAIGSLATNVSLSSPADVVGKRLFSF